MIKFAVIFGAAVGATYYLLMSAVLNTANTQAQAYKQQYQQAIALTEQIEQASNRAGASQ